MKSDRYHITIQATKAENQADLIAIAERKPSYIEYSPGGHYVNMRFGYKYQYQAIIHFQKFTARGGVRVTLENR